MAISNLTVYTGNVPLIGQTQIEFDTNTGNILGYLNSFGTDLNARVGEINTVISTTNGLAIAAASSASNAAISATNAGLAATRAEAVVIPTTATYSMDVINTRNTALSKSGFEAIARDNRDKFAGSGFVEWGKHNTGQILVNEGIWTIATLPNQFRIGRSNTPSGISKTNYPIASVNGVSHNLKYIQGIIDTDENNLLLLPPAPTVYPHGTTDTQARHLIDNGLAIEHADDSNSGLILNGKFDTALGVEWSYGNVTPTVSAGKLELDATLTSHYIRYAIPNLIVGKKYTFEFETTAGTLSQAKYRVYGNSVDIIAPTTYTIGARTSNDFIANNSICYLYVLADSGATGTITVDNIAVFPADAISRSDLVFLESWHEDTAEKGVLYDLGNTQYKGTISVGTAGTFSGSDTYSLFGNWQEANALVGNSISIASLTQAQLKTFVGKPENNCYYDGDKLIQVRYRVRSVGGLGDEWANVDTYSVSTNAFLSSLVYGSNSYISAKGKKVSIASDTGLLNLFRTTNIHNVADIGVFTNIETVNAYEGKCYALPIALVHRRNQGGYDATYNINGTALSSGTPASIADCFVGQTLGNIGTTSYHPLGLFYDQISEVDFTPAYNGADLRSSAQVKQYEQQFKALVIRDAASDLTHYPITTEVGLIELATDGVNKTLDYSPTTGRVYYTNATAQYQTDSFIKLGAIS